MLQWRPMRKVSGLPWVLWFGILAVVVVIVTLAFLPGAKGVRLRAVSPGDGSDDVPITAPVRLSFSQAMDLGSLATHFFVEPQVQGRWVLEGTEALFWPQGGWSPATAYTITLEAGVASMSGHLLTEDRLLRFVTRAPQLLYLQRIVSGEDTRQLFAVALGSDQPRPLTDHAFGVWDYAVHPQGDAIVYSVLRQDGGSDLWRMDRHGQKRRLLLACPDAACLNPTWAPDGRHLAYERRDIWADATSRSPRN
ncbi:MAG: Ig-like domain-containing protein, partial [Anaerolineae bacterium]